MAFEQNMALQRLVNPQQQQYGMAPQQQFSNAAPRLNASPLNQGNGGGWWDSVKNYLFGTDPQQFSYSPYTDQQQNFLQNILQSGQYNMSNPYQGFEELQNNILDQYKNNILPQIAEQFTGGTGGAASSPDFAKSLQGGGQGLASMLLQHKIGYGQANRAFGLQQAQMGLQPRFETGIIPGQQGFLSGATNALAGGAGYGASLYGGNALSKKFGV